MIDKYKHLIRPTDKEFTDIWKECFFIPDTNVLLDFYRFTNETVNEIFEIFEKIKDRLFLPFQVGKEFLIRRPDVVIDQFNFYDKAIKIIEKLSNEASEEIRKEFNL